MTFESEPAPGGMQLKIRDIERGQVLVALDDGKDSVAIGLLPHERKAAAEALVGDDHVVLSRDDLIAMRDRVTELAAKARQRGPFEYEEPAYDRTEEDRDKAAGLGKIGL
jgi:hypothetical protein